MVIDGSDVHCITLSQDIISEIIGQLHDDKKTLLTLGLVSKHTLYESRRHLFSTVECLWPSQFPHSNYGDWGDFNKFIMLVDVEWTSLTPIVKCLSLQHGYARFTDDDSVGTDIPLARAARIRTNLPNVKSLRFISLGWNDIPSYLLDLVFRLPIEHLSLCRTGVHNATNLLKLFKRFPSSLRTLDFKGMRPATGSLPDRLSAEPSIFHCPLRFETLDSQSLLLFESVWDPLISHPLNIKVESFCLQPEPDQLRLHELAAPFISRFLQHIGPSLANLKISLADLGSQYKGGIKSLLDPTHASRCTNLRSLNIGEIRLENKAPNPATMLGLLQIFLSALPAPGVLQAISVTIKAIALTLEEQLNILKSFEWTCLVQTAQRIFPNLQQLSINVGTRRQQDYSPLLDLIRQATKVKKLEEEGFIKLHAFQSPRRRCGRR